MLPVEYIYADWLKWVVYDEVLRSDPKYVAARKAGEIETGSQVEGFCLPEFRVSKNTDHFPRYENRKLQYYSLVTPDILNTDHWIPDHDAMNLSESVVYDSDNHPVQIFSEVVHCPDDPRYLKLKISDEWKRFLPTFKEVTFFRHSILFLPNDKQVFFSNMNQHRKNKSVTWTCDAHGPVRKLESFGDMTKFEEDQTQVFKYPHAWPEPAMEWLVRPRIGSWPSPDLVQEIVESGCHIAPVGRGKREHEPQATSDYFKNPGDQDGVVHFNVSGNKATTASIMDETEWRLSFSVAENRLGQSVTPVQRHIMVLLKMIKKMYFSEVGVSTYLLKNLIFWEVEKQDESFWSENNSAKCLLHMLDVLEKCLEEGFLPQYIMPKSNLLKDEDPKKLARAVVLIREVRRDLLPKLITMFQRCCSLQLHSPTFHRRMYFEPFLGKLKNGTLSDGEVIKLVCSLLSLFISRCKDCIESMHRIHAKDDASSESAKRSIHITLNVYESLITRCLTKLWFLQNPHSKNLEEFITFVKHESTTFPTNDCLVQQAVSFFQQALEGKDLANQVPSTQAMENIKQIYRVDENITLKRGKASTDFIKKGELFKALEVLTEWSQDVAGQDMDMKKLTEKFNSFAVLLDGLAKKREDEKVKEN